MNTLPDFLLSVLLAFGIVFLACGIIFTIVLIRFICHEERRERENTLE